MSLKTLNQYSLAIELLTLKPRISIVHQETGLPLAVLRRAFVDMHGHSPSRGSIKTTPEFILKNVSLHKHAILFGVIFELDRKQQGRCDALVILSAYRRYLSSIDDIQFRKSVLDFSESWLISKWLTSKVISLGRCRLCRSAKLIISTQQAYKCCVCKR
jgi:hypothetical protein